MGGITYKTQKKLANFIFLVPASALFLVWVIIPFVQGIPISFTNWDGISKTREFVGIDNYIKMLAQGDFWLPLKNTVYYTILATAGANILGLLLALGILKSTRLNSGLRTIFFMPHVLSVVLCAYIWKYMYSDIIYRYLAINSPLGRPEYAIIALALIAIWRDAGYGMIIYIAGLKMVPEDYYEAAKVEGAGTLAKFFKITLPLIVPSITANVILMLSWGLKQFDLVMAGTGGGPGKATETLAIFIYRNIFEYYAVGYGQAASVLFTIFVTLMSSSIAYLLRKKEVEY
jgi:raffinose/stachyose/melibiose transport system permease protein